MQISVRGDLKHLTSRLTSLQRKVIPNATRRAINKTANQVKSQAAKEISQSWGFKRIEVRKAINIRRANFKKLVAVLSVSGRPQPLIKHATSARQTRRGVVARIGGKSKLYEGTYLATMPSGHKGIFKTLGGRRGKTRQTIGGKNRGQMYQPGLPIKELYAPSIPTAFIARRTQDLMRRAVRERFPKLFEHEIKYALSRTKH